MHHSSLLLLFGLLALSCGQTVTLTIPTNVLYNLDQLFYSDQLQTNPNVTSFVEGVIFDRVTNALHNYNPLVITNGTSPIIPPTPISLIPGRHIVGLWFSTNANTLILRDTSNGTDLAAANCINGLPLTNNYFGPFAYCNAVSFFSAVTAAITGGLLNVPLPIMAYDGYNCPSIWNFLVADQTPGLGVMTTYLVVNGQVAQNSAFVVNSFNISAVLNNPGDNLVLSIVSNVVQCPTWQIPSMVDNGTLVTTLATNAIQAATWSGLNNADVAANVPPQSPSVLLNGQIDTNFVNLLRQGLNQPPVSLQTTFGQSYLFCSNWHFSITQRLYYLQYTLVEKQSPNFNLANNLMDYLALKAADGWNHLQCSTYTSFAAPITVTKNVYGVVNGYTWNFSPYATYVPFTYPTYGPPHLLAPTYEIVSTIILSIFGTMTLAGLLLFFVLAWRRRRQ